MSSEIYPADVAVYNDMIVAVGDVEDYIGSETEIIDATGYYLTPGMIDGHIHSECSKMSITSYAKAVVPRGTTSMISGLDEYISVSGLEGLQEVLAEMKQSPLKVFWGAPYKTPYTIPKSTVAFNFTEEDEDTLGAIVEASKNRLPVFGCAPMAVGNDLNGYLCGGVRLDHESYTHEEVVDKMRKGMHMLIRESCVTHFLEENIKAVTEVNPAFARRVSFCTDDVTARDILEKGRYYAVKKQSDGLIHADYCNSSQEDAALKLTLTALEPHAEFIIHVQRQEPYKLRANAAGIFESRFLVPAGRRIDIDEENKETK